MRDRQAEHRVAAIIREAFAQRRYPGDDNLVTGSGIDSTSVVRDFRGKRWDEIPIDALCYNRDGMSFMTPDAFAYYFPAFLLASMSDHELSADIGESAVWAITPAPGAIYEQSRQARLQQFSHAERRAIEEFLRYYFARHRPDPEAPPHLWKQYHAERDPLRVFWNID